MLQLECSELILNHAWIDNQRTESSDGRTFTVEDPADGTVLATLPDCGPVEAEAAVASAQRAFCSCRTLLAKERAQHLQAWLVVIRKHAEDLARLISLEEGKPLSESRGEVAYGAAYIEWFAEEAKRVYGDVRTSVK
jgi:succinate-semialdehyde dehydrogenase / glutarate-semialdehyde dehydrogenase